MKVVFVALSEPYSPYSPPVAALSAAVRAAGHESVFLGFPLASAVRDAADAIARAGGDVVAVTAMSRDWPGVRSLLPQVKAATGAFTVVGGYHATLAARQVAECSAVDAICIGEGELCFPALLDRLEGNQKPSTFPGMWLRGDHGFVGPVPPSAPGLDIAALPRWDYEVLGGVDRLLAHGVNVFGDRRDRFFPRRASRGCPYDCTFCSAPKWGSAAGYDEQGARNVWPVEDLCRDLAELRDRHAPDGFEFWDEHFPIDLAWLRELAREYPRRVGLPFRAEMHPSAATRERLELLASAGCVLFHCGVEQGDPEFRRRVLNRRSSDAVLERVFADARSLGLTTSASVMVACPNETVAQIEATLALLRRLRPDHIFCSKYHPLPGTVLGDMVPSATPVHLERFDDYRKFAPLFDPRCLDDAHAELFGRFDALKQELADGHAWRQARRAGSMKPMRTAFLAVDTRWEDPAGKFTSFSYAARKLEASVRGAPDLGHVETQVIDLKTDDPDAFFEAIREFRPTVVAASTYIWSVATFLEVARRVKNWDPSVRVVLGGPAARQSLLSLAPYQPLVRYVDAIATGDGEEVVRSLARDEKGSELASIPGLLLPHSLGFRATAPMVRPELDAYPSPYQLGTAPLDHTGYIETFRGCPISCAFCQWGDEKSDRVYGVEYLTKHLQGLLDSRAESVFFTDAAFNLSARAFRNLLEAERAVDALSKVTVRGHLYPTHVKEEHLEFLDHVGHAQVAVGVQSFDAEVLRRLGRPFDLARFERVLVELRPRMQIDIELICGLPGDNPDSFRRTLEKTLGIADTVRVFYPLVLPDALLERADEFGIQFDPRSFLIEECQGWSAKDLRGTWDAVERMSEGLANRIVRPTWVGFATHPESESAPTNVGTSERSRSTVAIPPDQVQMLATSLGAHVTGWSVAAARRENDALLLDLGSPRGAVVLHVIRSREGVRFFSRHGGLAYSYRGEIDRATVGELGRVIEAIHPATSRLLAAQGS